MSFDEAVHELNSRKHEIDQLEKALKEKVAEFHQRGIQLFDIIPSNQPFSIADVAQVIKKALEDKNGAAETPKAL